MTLPKYALDYDKCTRKELRAFVKARSWNEAENQSYIKKPKSYYVSKLRELDTDTTFRIMDLPPEMRNLVYENLLIRDVSSNRSASIAVLRTCQQMYREAHGIFLAENSLRLVLFLFDLWGRIEGDIGTLGYDNSGRRYRDSWSQTAVRLSSAHNFDICLDFDRITGWNSEKELIEILHGFLHIFVQNCPNAKQVKVRLTNMDEHRVTWKPQQLEPFKSLPKGCKLRSEGLSEQQEADYWHMVGQEGH